MMIAIFAWQELLLQYTVNLFRKALSGCYGIAILRDRRITDTADAAHNQGRDGHRAPRRMTDWMPNLAASDKPRYLAIADAIAQDIRSGRLGASDRLPPQRKLARRLDIDFTTVARGYVEAQKRGLIESHVGRGTFVRASARRRHSPMARHPEIVDLSMNLPPEPDDPELLDRMQDGLEAVGRDLVSLLRYQGFGGVPADKDAASNWLSRRALVPPQERLFIAPGAHPAILGILGLLAKEGDAVLSEQLTYPGARSIAAQLGLKLFGLPMDDEGVDADAFARACAQHAPKALYLNPTLLNPTTHTISERRRIAIGEVARRFGVPIVEDDPYGFLPTKGPPPFATIAAVRRESLERQRLADAILRKALPPGCIRADPIGFHLWVSLPEPWTRSAFVGHMRSTGIGVVASDAFATQGVPPEAARVCLGGPPDRAAVRSALEFMAHALEASPTRTSTFL